MTVLDNLREHLLTVSPGPVADDGTIAHLLVRAWEKLAGSDAHGRQQTNWSGE
jgi:hypothetical protein